METRTLHARCEPLAVNRNLVTNECIVQAVGTNPFGGVVSFDNIFMSWLTERAANNTNTGGRTTQ